MTRWREPPQAAHEHKDDRFDPVLEGARHGLSRDLALEIWARIRAVRTGVEPEADDVRRFHEVAALVAARGGRLRPDVGRITRVDVELDRDGETWSPATRGRERQARHLWQRSRTRVP